MSRSAVGIVPFLAVLILSAACGAPQAKPGADAGVDAGGDEPLPDAGAPADAGFGIAAIVVKPDPELVCLNGCFFFTAGQSRQFVAEAKDANGDVIEGVPFVWSTSDETLATVDADGVITTKRAGETSVIATAEGVAGEAVIHIEPARVARISVEPNPITVAEGQTVQLTATAYDDFDNPLDDVVFQWVSANPAVATVDESGVVSGLSGGHVIIQAGSDRGFDPGWASVEVTSDTPRATGFGLSDVSMGSHHGCGLDATGAAWCWGWNFFGQLGVGRLDGAMVSFPVPEKVATTETFASLEMGAVHSCALEASGEAWCWGVNDMGQLGTHENLMEVGGTTVPMPVLGGHLFESLGAGQAHTCGITAGDHLLYCWGMGQDGSLGVGDTDNRPTPTQVDSSLTFTRVAAGLSASCALASDGKAYCMGRNGQGVLGTAEAPTDLIQHLTPTAVSGGHVFTELSLTASHVCALDTTGAAWCWGNDTFGQLGDGATTNNPIPQQVATAERFVKIAVGAHHSCGLQSDGDVFCWGNNSSGQLGDGTLTDSLTPVQVMGGEAFGTISASGNVTCGITTSGETLCWGSGYTGESGGGASGGFFVEPWPMAMPAP